MVRIACRYRFHGGGQLPAHPYPADCGYSLSATCACSSRPYWATAPEPEPPDHTSSPTSHAPSFVLHVRPFRRRAGCRDEPCLRAPRRVQPWAAVAPGCASSMSGLNWQPSTKRSKKSGVVSSSTCSIVRTRRSAPRGPYRQQQLARALQAMRCRPCRRDRPARPRGIRSRRRSRRRRRSRTLPPDRDDRRRRPDAELAQQNGLADDVRRLRLCERRGVGTREGDSRPRARPRREAPGRRTRLSGLMRPVRRKLGEEVDQAGAADPDGLRPVDRPVLDPAVDVERERLDGAVGGLHPVGDLAALEGRAGGAARSHDPSSCRDHDLGVRTDVDQHRHPFVGRVEPDGHEIGGDVGADVARDERRAPDASLRVRVEAELVGERRQVGRRADSGQDLELGGRLVGSLPDRRDVEPEEQVAHGRVADHHDLVRPRADRCRGARRARAVPC